MSGRTVHLGAAVAVAVLGVGAVACSSNDTPRVIDQSAMTTLDSTTTITAESVASSTSSSMATSTPDDAAVDADLVGTWTMSAAGLLASNTANVGGLPAERCDGEITMTFLADGTMSRTGTTTCVVAGMEIETTIDTTAAWSIPSPGTVSFSEVVDLSSVLTDGLEDVYDDAVREGTATYDRAGTALEITFADPVAGSITQTFTQA